MLGLDTCSAATAFQFAAQRYDWDMRTVVTPSSIEDVNEYVLGPVGAFLTSPGKRLRPVLCEAGCLLVGGRRADVRSCALALESFHGATLIHDDVEDDAKMRRGAAALHVIEGVPLAINAGDYGAALALGLVLGDGSLADSVKVRILDEFVGMAKRTAEGRAMDIGWSRDGRLDMSVEECLLMIEGKTACYTCVAPLVIGGIVAGADARQVDALRFVGKRIGLAFQIRDDLDNLLSIEGAWGKGRALDTTMGKRTVIVAHALAHSDEMELLTSILASSTENPMQVKRAVGIMEKSGSLAFAEDLIDQYCAEARQMLEDMFSPGEGLDLLEGVFAMIEADDGLADSE